MIEIIATANELSQASIHVFERKIENPNISFMACSISNTETWLHDPMTGHRIWATAMPSVQYRQVSNIRRTKSQNLKDSRTVLWLSLPNPLKPDVKSRMKM